MSFSYLSYFIFGIIGFVIGLAVKIALVALFLIVVHEIIKRSVAKEKMAEIMGKIMEPQKAASFTDKLYAFDTIQYGKGMVDSVKESRAEASVEKAKEAASAMQIDAGDNATIQNSNNIVHIHMDYPSGGASYFDGGLLSYIGHVILATALTTFTLGFGFPWACCIMYSWEVRHTVINGRRLKFIGTGGSLFLNWLLWTVLTIITFGIFSFWLVIKFKKWKTKNTVFEG